VGSDGLMELDGRVARMEDVVAELDCGDGAAAVVERLVGQVRARRTDDATILVLRRLAPANVPTVPEENGRQIRK
jgi:hypothetical protein